MAEAEVLPVSVDDIAEILPFVRQADIDEISESMGVPMER